MIISSPVIEDAVQGIPLPYSPAMDSSITVMLLLCFFLSAYVLYRSKEFFIQMAKDFILHKERTSIFAISTGADMRYLLLLILQTCILSGVYFFNLELEHHIHLTQVLPGIIWITIYAGIFLLFIILKWMIYSVLGWIFFDKSKTESWIESYSTLLYYLGLILFPCVLLIVYFDLSYKISIKIVFFLFITVMLLTLFKWYKLFCNRMYGCMLLFLYFCTLEIIPCMVAYKGIIELSNYLIVKI